MCAGQRRQKNGHATTRIKFFFNMLRNFVSSTRSTIRYYISVLRKTVSTIESQAGGLGVHVLLSRAQSDLQNSIDRGGKIKKSPCTYITDYNYRRRVAPLRIPRATGRWSIAGICCPANCRWTGRCKATGSRYSWPGKSKKTNTWRSGSAAVRTGG